ncbi:MAG: hypothetical protein IJR14_05700 [Synergistaceae bacterium]|nr:hypothetical protein [Synergistaceae bacterium]
MGVGPSAKETTLHHVRDPLLDVASSHEGIDLLGVMLFGASDSFAQKMLVAERAAAWAQGMRADGALVFTEGSGNDHVDFAHVCEELERRGVTVVGLTPMGRQGSLVVTNASLDAVVDVHKSASGAETCVVGENTLTDLDCRKALAMLELKMRRRGPS